jgi:transposase-like protein
MPKKTNLTDAQKVDVVLRLLRKEEPASALARRYGISDPTLFRWRDEFLASGKAALANGSGAKDGSARRVQELERELADRDQVIGELTIANRILKKLSDGSI